MDETRLKTILEGFRERRILVVGDFYLDAYWLIDKTKSTLSLETPWHTNPVVGQRYSPGAAGTVTNNLRALEVGEVYTLGVIGEDGFGRSLLDCLQANGCITDFMIAAPDRVTPTYLKPIHRGYEGIETEGPRFDIENHAEMGAEVEEAVIRALHQGVPMVEGVIIGDQMPHDNWGVITDRVRGEICRLAVDYPDKVFYADSRTRIGKYRHVIIKPNRFEAKRAVDANWTGVEVDVEEAKRCGRILTERTGKPVYLTVGERGILIFHDGRVEHVPGVPLDQELDPVGAGDSVSAGIVPTLCGSSRREGNIYVEAAQVGNLVASITVTKLGTTGTASHAELIERFRAMA
ncbi:MAG: PfkB family carbohydrate kinase [Candidatus Poribacteria bacterium]|nr:PfkB family carbohydrate kinase [Candidatus Poribacteria bacterium]